MSSSKFEALIHLEWPRNMDFHHEKGHFGGGRRNPVAGPPPAAAPVAGPPPPAAGRGGRSPMLKVHGTWILGSLGKDPWILAQGSLVLGTWILGQGSLGKDLRLGAPP